MDDGRLLVEQARSDPHAFGQLFDRHYDDIYKYILHRTANAELAQDLTSETFFKALHKLWTFRWQNVPFSAWLFRIASNEVNGFYRKYKNFKSIPLEEAGMRQSRPKCNIFGQALPDEETYFANIVSQNGLLYLYRSHFTPGRQQQIDIFSSEGKYLYRGFVRVEEGYTIAAGPTIQNNCIYMVLEDQAGETTLNKYKTVLPR